MPPQKAGLDLAAAHDGTGDTSGARRTAICLGTPRETCGGTAACTKREHSWSPYTQGTPRRGAPGPPPAQDYSHVPLLLLLPLTARTASHSYLCDPSASEFSGRHCSSIS
eukprot:CAMPEP_0185748726 /NCGR_PEP_ID=MMETSP1174-20130828/7430_1 /TAXON_ID=35687 /ORGANISM="Dictyocha speculum, Strain CCMP1381" /LENGTH=109 /DNA_ID=CAMNT_0028424533 /DNA_START=205 /DNA_END=534 /DNA_ORIENTATION=-